MISLKKNCLIVILTISTICIQITNASQNNTSKTYDDLLSIENYDKNKLPIVYHEKYNVSFGLFDAITSRLHPFDGNKFRKIATNLGLEENNNYYRPIRVTEEDLLLVHTQTYLNSLNSSWVLSEAVDMGKLLAWVPNSILQKRFLEPMKYATGGTILTAQLTRHN